MNSATLGFLQGLCVPPPPTPQVPVPLPHPDSRLPTVILQKHPEPSPKRGRLPSAVAAGRAPEGGWESARLEVKPCVPPESS